MPNLPDQEPSDRLRPGEAARLLAVGTKTLATMPGLHPVFLPSGHRRYLRSEIEALAAPTNPTALAADAEAVAS